jgi:PAS domain S-box-containing protein
MPPFRATLATALRLSYACLGPFKNKSLGFMDRSITRSDPVRAPTSPELKLIYETAPIGLAFLSTDYRYLLINRHLTEICGISVAEHIGKTVREMVSDVADQVENIVQTVLRTGEPVVGIAVNGQRADKQNADRLWTTNWHPLKGPEGTIIGISVVAEEITERKRAEAALRELNRTLEQRVEEEAQERLQIWNVCQDLLVICDLEGIFLKVNPAWTATLGWHESELLGKSSQWMIHPDDRRQALVETENLAAGRILHRFGLRFRGKNGSYRWLSWRAVPHQGRIYAMARDETEQKHAEDRLREAQQELERVSRQTTIGAMTASIAHEINQPLSAIIASGNAGLRWLTRKDPDLDLDEVQKALQGIVDDGLRAADIITSIRGMFSQGQSRKTSTQRQRSGTRSSHTHSWRFGKTANHPPQRIPRRPAENHGRTRAVAAGTAQPDHECCRCDECRNRARASADDPGSAQRAHKRARHGRGYRVRDRPGSR